MAKKKEIKKEEAKLKRELKQTLESDINTKSTIITIVAVVFVFVLTFFLTDLILNRSRKLNYKTPVKKEVEINYQEILYTKVFKQYNDEYYVLFYDFNGNDSAYYNEIAKDKNKNIYTVDLGNPFNSKVFSETTNKNVQRYEDLKVKEATLIKIKNGRNVFYFEGSLLYIKENIK